MSVPESAIGRRVQCPRCRHVFRYSGQREVTLGRVKPKAASQAKAAPMATVAAGAAVVGVTLAKAARVDRNHPDTVPLAEMEMLLSEAKETPIDNAPIEEVVEVTTEEAAMLFEPTPGEPDAVVAEHEVESLLAEPDFLDVVEAKQAPAFVEKHDADIGAPLDEEIDVAPPSPAPTPWAGIPNLDIEAFLDEEIAALPKSASFQSPRPEAPTAVEPEPSVIEPEPHLDYDDLAPVFDPSELAQYFQQSNAAPELPPLSLDDAGPAAVEFVEPALVVHEPPIAVVPPPKVEPTSPKAEAVDPDLAMLFESELEEDPFAPVEFVEAAPEPEPAAEFVEPPMLAELAPKAADADIDLAMLFESEVEPPDHDIVEAELAEPIVDDWHGMAKTKTKTKKAK